MATKSLRCQKLSHSPCFGPDETCQMFVPPENDLSSVAFKAGWSICMPLFLKTLVQSFIPCFLVFLYRCRPQATRKYFCHYACWCFSTFAPVPSIFLISCDFSSLKSSSLQFPSFLFYHPLLQSFPCEKGRDETASTPQKRCCLSFQTKLPISLPWSIWSRQENMPYPTAITSQSFQS